VVCSKWRRKAECFAEKIAGLPSKGRQILARNSQSVGSGACSLCETYLRLLSESYATVLYFTIVNLDSGFLPTFAGATWWGRKQIISYINHDGID
jgi:hypothetical protein